MLTCATTLAGAQPLQSKPCSIAGSLPDDTKLYHVASYGGTSSLGAVIELDNSGHEVKKVDVLVNLPGRPIVLVLTAYDPVVWNVAWTAGSRIVGAVVSGYHGQAVLGIPQSIPLYLKTYAGDEEARARRATGHCPYFYAYKQDREYPRAEQAIQRITGLQVSRFIAAPAKGIALVGDAMPASLSGLESSPDYWLEDFVVARKAGEVPAGVRGFDELAKRGRVRQATPEDIRRFEASGVKGIIRGLPTYVVLKPITIPDGLYGGNLVNILLPQGVPMPKGNPGHSSVFRYGESKCRGPVCR